MPVEIDDLEQTSRLAAKVAWGDLPPAVVGDGIEGICRARNQTDAALLLAVRSFEARAEHRAEGHGSVAGWLRHHCHLTKREAARVARLARFCATQPDIEAALAAGAIGLAHVEVIADCFQADHAVAWAVAMPALVEYATLRRFEDFSREARRLAAQLAPKTDEERFREILLNRKVEKAGSFEGHGYVRAWMDPFGYQVWSAEHDRIERQLFEEDWNAARELLGRDPTNEEIEELVRTKAQRNHDAMVQMAERSKAYAGGTVASSVSVVLHIDWETWQIGLARLIGEDVDVPIGGFSETEDGTLIPPAAAVWASIVAKVRGIVFGADGEVLHFGRERRLFSPAQAAAIRAMFRRCTHPYGCDRTGRAIQSDHIREHQDGGPTDIDNAKGPCGPHNRWKSRHRHDPLDDHGPPPDTGARRKPPRFLPPDWRPPDDGPAA